MCLAVPGLVVELDSEYAVVEIGGKRSRVSLNLLPADDRPVLGDYLISHLGVALGRIDEVAAAELMAMIAEIAGVEEEALSAS